MPALSAKLKNIKQPIGPSYKLRPELLLHPNVPKPLHGVAPRVVLGQAWWDRERRAVYKQAEFFCQACGIHKYQAKYHKWLEAHEQYEIDYQKGRAKYVGAVALCHFCHCYIHSGRLQALLEKGEIHHHKFSAIHQHGDAVLAAGGLKRDDHEVREAMIQDLIRNGRMAEWSQWRLRIGRNLYKPLYASMQEWERAMSNKGADDE